MEHLRSFFLLLILVASTASLDSELKCQSKDIFKSASGQRIHVSREFIFEDVLRIPKNQGSVHLFLFRDGSSLTKEILALQKVTDSLETVCNIADITRETFVIVNADKQPYDKAMDICRNANLQLPELTTARMKHRFIEATGNHSYWMGTYNDDMLRFASDGRLASETFQRMGILYRDAKHEELEFTSLHNIIEGEYTRRKNLVSFYDGSELIVKSPTEPSNHVICQVTEQLEKQFFQMKDECSSVVAEGKKNIMAFTKQFQDIEETIVPKIILSKNFTTIYYPTQQGFHTSLKRDTTEQMQEPREGKFLGTLGTIALNFASDIAYSTGITQSLGIWLSDMWRKVTKGRQGPLYEPEKKPVLRDLIAQITNVSRVMNQYTLDNLPLDDPLFVIQNFVLYQQALDEKYRLYQMVDVLIRFNIQEFRNSINKLALNHIEPDAVPDELLDLIDRSLGGRGKVNRDPLTYNVLPATYEGHLGHLFTINYSPEFDPIIILKVVPFPQFHNGIRYEADNVPEFLGILADDKLYCNLTATELNMCFRMKANCYLNLKMNSVDKSPVAMSFLDGFSNSLTFKKSEAQSVFVHQIFDQVLTAANHSGVVGYWRCDQHPHFSNKSFFVGRQITSTFNQGCNLEVGHELHLIKEVHHIIGGLSINSKTSPPGTKVDIGCTIDPEDLIQTSEVASDSTSTSGWIIGLLVVAFIVIGILISVIIFLVKRSKQPTGPFLLPPRSPPSPPTRHADPISVIHSPNNSNNPSPTPSAAQSIEEPANLSFDESSITVPHQLLIRQTSSPYPHVTYNHRNTSVASSFFPQGSIRLYHQSLRRVGHDLAEQRSNRCWN